MAVLEMLKKTKLGKLLKMLVKSVKNDQERAHFYKVEGKEPAAALKYETL